MCKIQQNNKTQFTGTFLPISIIAAMKFTSREYESYAKYEFEMFPALYAINDTNVEEFEMPSVHYYGRWQDYTLMALTLLDIDCNGIFTNYIYNEADILIVFRECVGYSYPVHT